MCVGVVFCGGCASQQQLSVLTPPEPAIVWPKPPDRPRVRYIGQVSGSRDIGVTKSLKQQWDELLFGPEPPEMMVTPHAVAVAPDSDTLAVADTTGRCVHLFDIAGRRYSCMTAYGPELIPLECPTGVAWSDDGRLWIADALLGGVIVIDGQAAMTDPRARTGDAGAGARLLGEDELVRPTGICWCASTNMCYVTDTANSKIVGLDDNGTVRVRFGGEGLADGQFNRPTHIDCRDGQLIIADAMNVRVQIATTDGTITRVFGRSGDAAGDFGLPKAAALGPDDTVWVVDARFENVQAFDKQGQLLMAFGGEGRAEGEFWLPAGICIDHANRLWIADTYNRRVQVFQILP